MSPRVEDDWSDSEDEENVSEIETSVLLGIPDGEIQDTFDLSDPSVSRIGGSPAFLPTRPLSPSSSQCTLCGLPMPLLVQIWCPFEGSAMDRVLYVWGCDRHTCQHKDGSMRAWRGLKFNAAYAAKLSKKKAKEAAKLARQTADESRKHMENKNRSINPFSLSAGTSTEVSGLGTQLFGFEPSHLQNDAINSNKSLSASGSESEDEYRDDREDGSLDAVTDKLASVTLQSPALSPEWSSFPTYKPVYLSTISEYLPSSLKSKSISESFFDEDLEGNKRAGKDWGLEGWEKSVDVDGTFEKFLKRVSNDNEQCVRYNLKGTPLPFGSRDKLFSRLWPPPPPAPFTTKPGFTAPILQRRSYDPSAIGKCGVCGSPRVFECQLMPNLINVLRAQGNNACNVGESEKSDDTQGRSPQTKEEQKKDSAMKLVAGMEWGTCFIFSCEKDCCNEEDGWREELALVQWDE